MKYKKMVVDIPTERVSFKKAADGAKYVYYHLRYYRNEKGTPTREEISIGKTSLEEPGKMYPNTNYFNYFEAPTEAAEEVHPQEIVSAGSTTFLSFLAEQLSLVQILKQVFGSLAYPILTLAYYMICEGNVMMYLDDFYETHVDAYESDLSSHRLTDVYEQITSSKRDLFFSLWRQHLQAETDVVAYDVTSISTQAKDIPMAEKGYNRDGDFLPQLNIGMFYSQTQSLPIGYTLYHGSLLDKTYFSQLVVYAEHLGLKSIIFVLDRGFLTKDHLQTTLKDFKFILALPASQRVYRQFLLTHAPTMKQVAHYSFQTGVYGVQSPLVVEDTQLIGCAYYDASKYAEEEQTIYQSIHEKEALYAQQVNRKQRAKRDTYYDLTMDQGTLTDYVLNQDRVQESLDIAGMFGLVTNLESLAADEVLTIYRRRNTIETAFDALKNELDFGRFKTHHQQSTQGKFFIGFIALILQAHIQRQSDSELRKKKPTIKGLIKELDKVYRVKWNDRYSLFAPLTKKQKEILGHFEIDLDVFEAKIIKNSEK